MDAGHPAIRKAIVSEQGQNVVARLMRDMFKLPFTSKDVSDAITRKLVELQKEPRK